MNAGRRRWLALIGPGMLVAATGVGAGDLATGALAGSDLGLAVLWAVLVGAALKYLVNEGLCRWQLTTGLTLLEGCRLHFGRGIQWPFLLYLVIWSYFVSSALMSACGAVAHAICPLIDATTDKRIYGIAHSAVALLLVLWGGFRLFEQIMRAFIGVMFLVTVVTAIALGPQWNEVFSGLFVPRIPAGAHSTGWIVGLWGGIGGTVTILCYGYWIREEGREGTEQLRGCRIDLAAGYVMTALFGIAMVIIGSTVHVEHGASTRIIAELALRLEDVLGAPFRWAFLIGAWTAVFSSLLGVWQSVPYLFADTWGLWQRDPQPGGKVDTRGRPYRGFLYALATIPAVGLWGSFKQAQLTYAVVGACFVPLLAIVLLLLNRRPELGQHRNSWWVIVFLSAALIIFVVFGVLDVSEQI